MTLSPLTKLAVIGAGSVGTSLAYAAAIRGSANTVAIYDVNREKVEAEVLDLSHGTQFFQAAHIRGGADIECVRDADVVVITAGARQKPGQTRIDLAGTNIDILSDLLPKLLQQAPNAIYMLVTNPCDILTTAALQISGLPRSRVLSSGTVLDSSRLRWLVGRKVGISPRSVHSMMIGEHGDTEFALWSSATIGQAPLLQWCDNDGNKVFTPEILDELEHEVTDAAYRIIKGKGATNYAIGVAGARIVEALFGDHHAVLPVSTMLDGYRGISGVALSVPSVVGRKGVERTIEFPFDEREDALFHKSAEALLAVQRSLGI
ncbi:L-lactate dehydrogenase [Bowdeniella nasicola]|uniref:L-lactate dehydrogenase n=1 Tax=Bowdeniella nasicola TaxID=208480 RepID=A0A1Q5Q5J9_9ACTO|nr:L-lactate dehydrogenase [Bowdeniella nasicola]OKL54969.1 L-lactate dehydrogenase [Bowdeniella nasicola]